MCIRDRVLIAALTLVMLTVGALAVSADFRRAVYPMIQKFLPIEMQLTYQVDGEPLEWLPDGYSDHYVPDVYKRQSCAHPGNPPVQLRHLECCRGRHSGC